MITTLIVKYTPREGSNTRTLLNEVEKIASKFSKIEVLDLVETPPDLLLYNNLNAYVKKHLSKSKIKDEEQIHLKKMESMADQVLSADIIVLGFPIYNFNMPAAIKAWIDSILIAGKTFIYTEYGPDGLLKGKKLLVINTSDTTKPFTSKDYSSPYIKEIASFMGITDFKITGLFGIKYTGISEVKLDEFKKEISEFLKPPIQS